jgi:hypothetical protein
MNVPKPGEKLANGAVVIHYTHFSDGSNGYLANGLALCVRESESEPYVVWDVTVPSSVPDFPHQLGAWNADTGRYFGPHKFSDAIGVYLERGGLII